MFIYNYFTNNDFTIYGRNKSNDSYKLLFTIDEGNPMSRFKHEVYGYALGKKHHDQKSLYLYCGYYRMAKCIAEKRGDIMYVTLLFNAGDYAEDWDNVREQIPKVHKDMAWFENTFKRHWAVQVTDNQCERLYQNYRMTSTI